MYTSRVTSHGNVKVRWCAAFGKLQLFSRLSPKRWNFHSTRKMKLLAYPVVRTRALISLFRQPELSSCPSLHPVDVSLTLVQVVTQSNTIANIQREKAGKFRAAFRHESLFDWIKSKNDTPEAWEIDRVDRLVQTKRFSTCATGPKTTHFLKSTTTTSPFWKVAARTRACQKPAVLVDHRLTRLLVCTSPT